MDNNNTRKQLNEIYQILHAEKDAITDYLSTNDVLFVVGYYPFHSFKENNEFYIEQYPIPVITINGFLDVGIDIDKIFFEFRFTREKAMDFDFNTFAMYDFEVYGVEDYYEDYYFDDINEISHHIESSNEEEIGVSILIDKENIIDDVKDVLELLSTHLIGELI